MAILTRSDTPIELLLKAALQKENLTFREQQRIYEKGSDLHPKYVADFVVLFHDTSIIVECDGESYHSSDLDVKRDIERDQWLMCHGYQKVLHFTAYQLRYEMKTVILNIKYYLGIINIPKRQLRFHGKRSQARPIVNIHEDTDKLHQVTLYYSYIQVSDKVWIVYKFRDDTLNCFSEERFKVFYNVPDKLGNQLSIRTALTDLKRSVNLVVFCPSSWLTSYLNGLLRSPGKQPQLLTEINEELKKHNYLCKYINIFRNFEYYDNPSTERLIIHELRSRCLQLRHGKCTAAGYEKEINFQDLYPL